MIALIYGRFGRSAKVGDLEQPMILSSSEWAQACTLGFAARYLKQLLMVDEVDSAPASIIAVQLLGYVKSCWGIAGLLPARNAA